MSQNMYCATTHNVDWATLETVLYNTTDPSGGVSGNITLSQSIDNFDEVAVYYRIAYDYTQNCSRVRVLKNVITNLDCIGIYNNGNGSGNFKMAQVRISGTSLTFFGQAEWAFGGAVSWGGEKVYITRVVGIKKQGTI